MPQDREDGPGNESAAFQMFAELLPSAIWPSSSSPTAVLGAEVIRPQGWIKVLVVMARQAGNAIMFFLLQARIYL